MGDFITAVAFFLHKERTSTQLSPVPTRSEICFSKYNTCNTKGMGHQWTKTCATNRDESNTFTDFSK